MTAWGEDVGEDAGRPAEDVVLQRHTLIDRDVVLDLHVVAYLGPGHDDDILSEIAPLADPCSRHHVTEVPDLASLSDLRAVIDVRAFVNEVVHQMGALSLNPISLTSGSRVTPYSAWTRSRAVRISASTSAAVAEPRFTM